MLFLCFQVINCEINAVITPGFSALLIKTVGIAVEIMVKNKPFLIDNCEAKFLFLKQALYRSGENGTCLIVQNPTLHPDIMHIMLIQMLHPWTHCHKNQTHELIQPALSL